jgi:hypothetical protein
VTLRKFSDEGNNGGKDKEKGKENNPRLTREWEDLFRSSTVEYYEKVAVQDLSEVDPEEYIKRVSLSHLNCFS